MQNITPSVFLQSNKGDSLQKKSDSLQNEIGILLFQTM